MLVRPLQTEKAFSEITKNTYIFSVPLKSSKQSIKEAVEKDHKVTVISVRVVNRKGKPTRYSRGRRAYPGTTHRQDKRFAYVALKEGDKIKVFDEEPATEAKAADTKEATVKATDAKESTQAKKAGLFTKRRTGTRGDK